MTVRVQAEPFDFAAEAAGFAAAQAGAGAVVTFTGIVRDTEAGLVRMEIEHYPGMTERALSDMAAQAVARWSLTGALVIHRHGVLAPGEMIMMVATAAPHRADAFAAAGSFDDPLDEAIRRMNLMEQAGADSLYPVKLPGKEALNAILEAVTPPVNVTAHPVKGALPEGLDIQQLAELGVGRISFGPLLQAALGEQITQLVQPWQR